MVVICDGHKLGSPILLSEAMVCCGLVLLKMKVNVSFVKPS